VHRASHARLHPALAAACTCQIRDWPLTVPPVLKACLAGCAVFLICYVSASIMAGPETCADGWHSPSIGRSGACFHHHGVGNWQNSLAFFGSLGIAGAAGYGLHRKMGATRIQGPSSAARDAGKPAPPGPVAPARLPVSPVGIIILNPCPVCGAKMIERVARRGSRKGKPFWGCSRFPSCMGVRHSAAFPAENDAAPAAASSPAVVDAGPV
jgi:hypothetical protein